MTITINDQINQARKTRRQIEQRLKEQDELIEYLYELRLQCDHDFNPAQKGYEHEGGYCKKCGIGELQWSTIRSKQSNK